jgi:hypothetical protein
MAVHTQPTAFRLRRHGRWGMGEDARRSTAEAAIMHGQGNGL